jgi:hypothetical protein
MLNVPSDWPLRTTSEYAALQHHAGLRAHASLVQGLRRSQPAALCMITKREAQHARQELLSMRAVTENTALCSKLSRPFFSIHLINNPT